MTFLRFVIYGEICYHIGLFLGAIGGFYGWYPS